MDRGKVPQCPGTGTKFTRNRALEQAKGAYVCFLDSDDIRPAWALQTVSDLIDEETPDLIITQGYLSQINGFYEAFYDTELFKKADALIKTSPELVASITELFAHFLEPQSANKFVRRDIITVQNLRFPNTHFFEDIYFHTMVIAAAEKICLLDKPSFTYYRQYAKKQLTRKSSEIRLDIVPVTNMTLEAFSRTDSFNDPILRGAVLASCHKLIMWCQSQVSHHYRAYFHNAVKILARLIHPAYLIQIQAFSPNMEKQMDEIKSAQNYFRKLKDD